MADRCGRHYFYQWHDHLMLWFKVVMPSNGMVYCFYHRYAGEVNDGMPVLLHRD